jgi:hypothetical protein
MASFRPEDEDKLTPQVLEEIETMLADALGFSGHQRHCGGHVNTNNMHLHVAYNRRSLKACLNSSFRWINRYLSKSTQPPIADWVAEKNTIRALLVSTGVSHTEEA